MVHPVEDGEELTTDFVDSHTGVQQSRSRAVAVVRRSYMIKEKRELVQAICMLASKGVSICQF
jgi:hypothetical protein